MEVDLSTACVKTYRILLIDCVITLDRILIIQSQFPLVHIAILIENLFSSLA